MIYTQNINVEVGFVMTVICYKVASMSDLGSAHAICDILLTMGGALIVAVHMYMYGNFYYNWAIK